MLNGRKKTNHEGKVVFSSFFLGCTESLEKWGVIMSRVKLNEIEVSHLKGSGPGGQNRNKRMSGVRVTHLPTGIVVVATERRSQKQNLEAAMLRLEEKLERLFHRPAPRKKTGPSRSSLRERLNEKKIHSTKKKLRSNKSNEWD